MSRRPLALALGFLLPVGALLAHSGAVPAFRSLANDVLVFYDELRPAK